MGDDVEITRALGSLGFVDAAARHRARAALEDAGLTNRTKTRISRAKLAAVRAELARRFARWCGDPACGAWLASARPDAERIVVAAESCDSCGGSPNARSARRFLALCRARGVRRLVVVGGSPGVREELRVLVADALELRLVDGLAARPLDRARADLAWADLVIVSGPSELTHKVSQQYRGSPKTLLVARRGIAALLDEAVVRIERTTA